MAAPVLRDLRGAAAACLKLAKAFFLLPQVGPAQAASANTPLFHASAELATVAHAGINRISQPKA